MVASKQQSSYHHGDLRRAIVDSAAKLIARRRSVAFTLRELASAAQVSHAAAYRHFANKTDILAAVAEVGFSRLHEEFVRVAASHRDAKRELAALGLAYVQFALAHEGFYRAMFHPELGDHGEYPALAKVAAASFGCLLDVFTRGVEQGQFRRRPPHGLAIFAWSAVHGLAGLLIDGLLDNGASADANQGAAGAASTLEPEQLSALVVDCVVRGVVATKD